MIILSTVALFYGKLDSWSWITFSGAIIGLRKYSELQYNKNIPQRTYFQDDTIEV